MEKLPLPELVDRHWDFLMILQENGDKGMTTGEITEYSRQSGQFDMSIENAVASKVAYDMRERKLMTITKNQRHYLSETGKKALEARRQKDGGLATPIAAFNIEAPSLKVSELTDVISSMSPAIVLSEAEVLSLDTVIGEPMVLKLEESFDFAPSISFENNPLSTLDEIMAVEEVFNEILPEEILPTLGQLSRYINAKPDDPEEIEILGVEQTLAKNGKYPFLSSAFDSITDWLDAEMAVKTVFIEDKGRKIALLNKIASFPLFDEEVREKLHEIAVDLEKLTDFE